MILNLAVLFAWHALWPQATPDALFDGSFEWVQAVVASLAFIARWQYKADIIKIIAVCARVGLIHRLTI